MSGSPDWEAMRAAFGAHALPGEPVEGIFTAALPDDERGEGIAVGGLWPVVMAVEYVMRRSAERKTGQVVGVPLSRRMIIAITPQRLIIGQADRGWRLRAITGELLRDRIVKVELGAAGSHSRRVILHLDTGESVTLRMARTVADQLRDHLSLRATVPAGSPLMSPHWPGARHGAGVSGMQSAQRASRKSPGLSATDSHSTHRMPRTMTVGSA